MNTLKCLEAKLPSDSPKFGNLKKVEDIYRLNGHARQDIEDYAAAVGANEGQWQQKRILIFEFLCLMDFTEKYRRTEGE